jgi:hypothetical protein
MVVSTSIEVGHRYSEEVFPVLDELGVIMDPHKPDEKHRALDTPKSLEVARALAPHATRFALLDDTVLAQAAQKVRPDERWRIDFTRQRMLAAVQTDTGADQIYLESSLEAPARYLVGLIQQVAPTKGHRIAPEKGNKLFIDGDRKNNFKLMGKEGIDDPTYPSCELLDLAWLMIRTQNYDKVITVLPRSFEGQQERVAFLATLIGIKPEAYATEFYD